MAKYNRPNTRSQSTSTPIKEVSTETYTPEVAASPMAVNLVPSTNTVMTEEQAESVQDAGDVPVNVGIAAADVDIPPPNEVLAEFYWSKSRVAFFPASLHHRYIAAGSWPDDAVAVADAVFTEYGSSHAPEGKTLGVSEDGLPTWVDKTPMTPEESAAHELQRLQNKFNRDVAALSKEYPDGEKDRWQQMAQEARRFLLDEIPTALLSSLAEAKGTTVSDVASSIATRADVYDQKYGKLLGEFQVQRANLRK